MTRRGQVQDCSDLRHLLVFEWVTDRIPDGAGGYEQVWEPVPELDPVWGRLEPLRGEERLRAFQRRTNATHELTMRWRPDITVNARMRVLFRGNVYYVVEPPRDLANERRTHWRFQVREEPIEFAPADEPGEVA